MRRRLGPARIVRHGGRRRCPRLAVCRALTLVEMLLVVAIVAILAGTVVVSFADRRDRHALRAAARELAAAIDYAQVQSRLGGTAHRVAFDELRGTFRVERLLGGGGDAARFVPADGLAGVDRCPADGVRVAAIGDGAESLGPTREPILFEPAGTRFAGRVTLTSRRGQTARIEVAAASGQVQVFE